jgi:hypothetical protein
VLIAKALAVVDRIAALEELGGLRGSLAGLDILWIPRCKTAAEQIAVTARRGVSRSPARRVLPVNGILR